MTASRKPGALLPPAEYEASLPVKRVVAGVVIRDRSAPDRVLLVEPTYKPNWEIPGGAVEDGEAPWSGAVRELEEELGLSLPIGRTLLIDYVAARDARREGVVFLFDGGVLDETDLPGLAFGDGEIRTAGFYTVAEARDRVRPLLADRLDVALAAAEQGVTALCEQGRRVA